MSTRISIQIAPIVHGDTTVTNAGLVVKNVAPGEVFAVTKSVDRPLAAAPLSRINVFYLKGTTATVNLKCQVTHIDAGAVPSTPSVASDVDYVAYPLSGSEGQLNVLSISTPLASFSDINEADFVGLGIVRKDTDDGYFEIAKIEFVFGNITGIGGLHTYEDYIEELQSLIKDSASKLTTTDGGDLAKILAKAVRDYLGQRPFSVRKKIQGNGTSEYLLSTIFGDLWKHGYSSVREIEYPIGSKPKEILDESLYEIYDDGAAQDGSNLILRFVDSQPQSGTYFIVEIIVEMDLPTAGAQNFPDTDENFSNITLLAAAYACQRLAAAYAPSSDATISADVVNYHDKSSRYQGLARQYLKQYNLSVFGKEDPEASVEAAMVSKPMRSSDAMGSPHIFHRRKDDLSGRSRL